MEIRPVGRTDGHVANRQFWENANASENFWGIWT